MNTFGEISWDDDVFGGDNRNANNKDLWMRLDEGENELRLVTQPFQYLMHKYKKEGDPGFGQKVYCSAIHGSCPLCDIGDKAKPRWLLGVISRKTDTYKILDVSFAVYSGIRNLARNTKHWGDPTKYDLNIQVNKLGGALGYYSVQGLPKEPLSAADQLIRDRDCNLEDLKRRVTPPSPEMVQKRLDKLNGVESATAPATSPTATKTTATAKKAKATATATVAPVAPVSMTEDEDETFPSYDSTN